MVKVKKDIVILTRLVINDMFLIMFISLSVYLSFFIPTKSHNVFKSKLAHIDHFLDDIDSFLVDTSTLVPDHHAHPPTAIPTLSGTVNSLPPHFSQHLPKSTRLLDFFYSFYSDSFTSFLTSIHNLSKPL